jgi:hypothetical protein
VIGDAPSSKCSLSVTWTPGPLFCAIFMKDWTKGQTARIMTHYRTSQSWIFALWKALHSQ